MKQKSYKTISSKIVHQNPWFKVKRDKVIRPNGKSGDYFSVVTNPSVFVVAMTEMREIYLIKQYRYPTKNYSWELPAGGTDGQNPLKAAKRELWEETGLIANKWKKIGIINPWNGMAGEVMHVFLVQGLVQTGRNKRKEEGILEVKKVPIKKALQMVRLGQITDGQTLAALLSAVLKLSHTVP